MGVFNRGDREATKPTTLEDGVINGDSREKPVNGDTVAEPGHNTLPTHTHNPHHKVHKRRRIRIKTEGESGRKGFNPKQFSKLTVKSASRASSIVNILWPFVPAAIALHFISGSHHVWTFSICYIAMVPCANLLGYAGQEFARKLPKVAGILIETTLGSVVEIVLFMVLIVKDKPNAEPGHGNLEYVIQAAILGSILTNLLLCLGLCFLVGGFKHKEQKFHPIISEVGAGILLVAGFALLIPSAFYSSLKGSTVAAGEGAEGEEVFTMAKLKADTASISHGVAIVLMVAFCIYLVYNAISHDNIFSEVLELDDERDRDRHKDLRKAKLTMTECLVAIVVSLVLISLIAVFLVEEIEYIVQERHVPDNFLGLILVPLVEKAAEHLVSIDEAYDNQIVSKNENSTTGRANETAEFRSVPLHRTLDPNRAVQCSSGRDCQLGPGQDFGSEFRDFLDCPGRHVHTCCR
jgi:Ca2+:H+ antiporter